MKLHCGTLLQGRGQRAELSPSFSRPIDIVVSKHLNITRVLKTDIRTREDLLWTWGHCPYRGICPLYSVDSSPLHTYNPSRPCASTWRNELAGWKVFPYFNLSRIAVHVVQGMNILRTTWFGGASPFVVHAESRCGRSGASCNIGTLDIVERTSDGVVVYRRVLQRVLHGVGGVSDIRHILHR